MKHLGKQKFTTTPPQGVAGLFLSLDVNQRNKFDQSAIYVNAYGNCECTRMNETIFLETDLNLRGKLQLALHVTIAVGNTGLTPAFPRANR